MTTIGDYAFSGCQNLKSFAFGAQVQTIGTEAFSDCTSVIEIASKAQTPPTCGTQALDDISKWDIADAVKIVNLVVGKIPALARPAKEVKDEKVPQ